MKREWIDSGFLEHVFDETTKRIKTDPLAIRDPAGYVAKRLGDDGFRAFREVRAYQARQAEIQRQIDEAFGRVPTATEPARPVNQVTPIARPNPLAAETRVEPASAAPRESSDPEPSGERLKPVPERIEPPVEPRDERPKLRIAEVASSRAEALEASQRREAADREARIRAEVEKRLKRFRNQVLMNETMGSIDARIARFQAEEPAKRAEIEAKVRAEFEPVQSDRHDWPTGWSEIDRDDKAPMNRRTGAIACRP